MADSTKPIIQTVIYNFKLKIQRICLIWDAALAQWIRLCLPSCRPWFESQAHHLHFYLSIFELCHVERMKINEKEAGIGPFFKASVD